MAGRPIGQYRMHLMWWHLAPCVTRASCFFQGETPDFWRGNVSRVPREGLGDFRRRSFYQSGNPNPLKKGKSRLGCCRKLGSTISKWFISPTDKWVFCWGYHPFILTFDPKFLGHPSGVTWGYRERSYGIPTNTKAEE